MYKNWKEYISSLMTLNDAFRLVKTEKVNQTFIEHYANTKNKTHFKVGYVDDTLMYLYLLNPDAPGLTEYNLGAYFFDSDFDYNRSSDLGLKFNEVNKKEIKGELENGLLGREEQYILNGKIIYSKLYLDDEHFCINIDLSGRTFWQKLFGPKVSNIKGVSIKIVDLKEIFSGI